MDITELKRKEQTLLERLRLLSSQLLHAHMDERKSIAGEIHDAIGFCLSAIRYKAENVSDLNLLPSKRKTIILSG